MTILFGQIHYAVDLLKRSSSAAELGVLLKFFRQGVDELEDRAKKKAMRIFLMEEIKKVRSEFMSGLSYWKDIYGSYFDVGVSYLYESRPLLAVRAFKQSLNYHPFYMNAYHLLSLIYQKDSIIRDKRRARLCESVYKNILENKPSKKPDLCGCVDVRYCLD